MRGGAGKAHAEVGCGGCGEGARSVWRGANNSLSLPQVRGVVRRRALTLSLPHEREGAERERRGSGEGA